MTTLNGILGQEAPAAATEEDLYTVPAAKHMTGKVLVANRGVAATFRVSLAPLGAATINAHYIAYDAPLEANEPLSTVGFKVGATDVVRVEASTADVSFTCTGIELDD